MSAEAADWPAFTGEVHPYADLWPMRPADEVEEMAESIRANGQRFPIVLSADGVLVDGRNRLAACDLADVEPVFEVRDELADEDAIVAFIWDANGDRRNLSKGQRAMLAAKAPGSTRVLSTQTDVTNGYINRARQVLQWCDDDVAAAVIDGTLALNDAYTQAQQLKATEQAEDIARKKAEKAAREQAERDAARLEDLRLHRPDLAQLVDEDRLALGEALNIRAADRAKEEKRAADKAAAIRSRNANVQAAFATLSELRHPEILDEVIDNWHPLVDDWTADGVLDLAELLTTIAHRWSHT